MAPLAARRLAAAAAEGAGASAGSGGNMAQDVPATQVSGWACAAQW